MARENGYLTSNRMIRYPLADDTVIVPSQDVSSDSPYSSSSDPAVWTDALSRLVFGCFVDALVQVKSAYSGTVPKLSGISFSGNTLSFSLLGSASEEPVRMTCTVSSDAFPVIRGTCSWCWYAFVLSSEGILACESAGLEDWDIRENRLSLNDRCVGKSSPGVTSIDVYGGERTKSSGRRLTRAEALAKGPDVSVSGDVTFRPGYNMLFSAEDSGFSMSAVPGAGDGVAPCGCTEDETSFKTPGLLSSDGHVRLFNDTCYDVVPSVSGNAGELALHVKCKACCTCGMYASIVNDRLMPLKDRILAARASLDATLAAYEKNVSAWNERLATALPEDVVVTSTATPLDAAATQLRPSAKVNGKMSRCGFSMVMRNDAFVDVRIELDEFTSNGKPFDAQVSYMSSAYDPVVIPINLSSNWSAPTSSKIFSIVLSPGRSASLTYFVRLDNLVKTDRQSGFIAKLKLSAYQGSRLIVSRYEQMSL